jgi:hypothetical protein
MSRRLNIKNFLVADTSTGRRPQSGREPTRFLSQSTLINDLSANKAVTNKTLQAITDASLNSHAHFSRSYIRVIRDYTQDISGADEVYIPDGIMRITFLSANAIYNSSLIYAFSPYPNKAINNLEWNVVIANSKTQTAGDYFDIQLPDSTYYPSLYVCFIIVKDAWPMREIVSENICRISSVSRFHYCVHPQKCAYDRNRPHFVVCNGLDTTTGIKTRITFGVEDDRHGYYCSCDYSDLVFSLSSRTYLNENSIW